MLIERKLKIKGGTTVSLDSKNYEFKSVDGDDSPHVCEVKDPAHIKILLGIDDGTVYVEANSPSEPEPVSDIPSDLKGKSKKQLAELAKAEFDVDLDVKKAVKTIIAEILSLRSDVAEAAAQKELDEADEAQRLADEAAELAAKAAE